MNNVGFTTYSDYRVRFSSKAQTSSRTNFTSQDFGVNRFSGKSSEQPESEESDIKKNKNSSNFGIKRIFNEIKEIYPLISPVEAAKIAIEALKGDNKEKNKENKLDYAA